MDAALRLHQHQACWQVGRYYYVCPSERTSAADKRMTYCSNIDAVESGNKRVWYVVGCFGSTGLNVNSHRY